MAVVKLKPAFKSYLWGGHRLKEEFSKNFTDDKVAETWELSMHEDGPSVVISGEHTGLTLKEYVDKRGKEVLGVNGNNFDFFPILVKFIDAAQDLSIQVHPDDAYALEVEGEYGKNEMWYILDAEEDAFIYYGTNQELSQEAFRSAIENNEVLDTLKQVPVKAGDVIYVEAGTIHAIGEGILLCEVQQNSNTTYRVYDFNRKDKDGNLRELHIDQAIEVSKLSPLDSDFSPRGEIVEENGLVSQLLLKTPYFETTSLTISQEAFINVDDTSFVGLICLEGNVQVDELTLNKGETAFVEANTGSVKLNGNGRLLKVSV